MRVFYKSASAFQILNFKNKTFSKNVLPFFNKKNGSTLLKT